MVRKVIEACGGIIRGARIAVLGLTFKPNTDDMRDAPALDLIRAIKDHGGVARVFDPEGMDKARRMLGDDVVYADDAYSCIDGADAVALVTEWDVFRVLDLDEVKRRLRRPVFIDLRNVFLPDVMRAAGFVYSSVGR